MEWLEGELQKTGDRQDELFARQIATIREFRGDIPLPSTSVETPKQESRVRGPISKEILEALVREGLTAAYSLTGESIADQQASGRKFWHIASSENGSLIQVPSITGDVVVDPRPNKFFLPRSNNLTLDQQLERIAEWSYKLQRRIGADAVEAVMGEAPDYSALTFAHFDATGERFFGQRYGFNYARTKTPTVGRRVAGVGSFFADLGLLVVDWGRGLGDDDVHAVPLVVAKAGA